MESKELTKETKKLLLETGYDTLENLIEATANSSTRDYASYLLNLRKELNK